MRALLLFPLLIFLFSCHQRQAAKVGGVEVPLPLLEAAEAASFDYSGHLNRALQGNAASLQQLFVFCKKTGPAPQQAHGEVLHQLLAKMGDPAFSSSIRPLSDDERMGLLATLETANGQQRLSETAPLSWAVFFPKNKMGAYQGLYVFSPTSSTFQDCARPGQRLLAIDETGEVQRNYLRLLRNPYPGQAIFVELKGLETAQYGQQELPSNYSGFLIVTEILGLEAKNRRNTCIPYELWAAGENPTWHLQVSSAERLIDFGEPGKERVWNFPYTAPAETDTATLYQAVNEGNGDNILIVVKEGKCPGGRAKTEHMQHVTVTMNGREFEGCGAPSAK